MLDNLRDQASFQDDEVPPEEGAPQPKVKRPRRTLDQATGMTAKQRFFLMVMLLIMVCLLGTMFLFATDKIVPPFL